MFFAVVRALAFVVIPLLLFSFILAWIAVGPRISWKREEKDDRDA